MNKYEYLFLLLIAGLIIAYGILVYNMLDKKCTLKHSDFKKKFTTFMTSMLISIGIMIILYSTFHISEGKTSLSFFNFNASRSITTNLIQVMLGFSLLTYGVMLMYIVNKHCGLEKDVMKNVINAGAVAILLAGIYISGKPMYNSLEIFKYGSI